MRTKSAVSAAIIWRGRLLAGCAAGALLGWAPQTVPPANAQVINYTNGENNSAPIELTNNTTQLQTLSGVTATQSGVISQDASARPLEKIGIGTLIFSGTNTYTGSTTVSVGTLQIGNGGTTGSIAGDTVNNSFLTFDRSNAYTYSGSISGSGETQQIGSGTLILTGSDTNQISTFGPLQIGNGGTTGSITGDVTLYLGGSLIFDRSDTYTYAGNVSNGTGGGSFVQAGATLIVTGNLNPLNGGTIASGTLQVGNGGTAGSFSAAITDNGALIFDLSNSYTYSSVVSGSGALTQAGTGTLTLSGANSYSGGTTVSAGTLQIAGSGTLGAASGSLTVSGGTLNLGVGGGGTQIQNGGVTLISGTIQGGTLSSSGTFNLQSGTVSTVLAGTGGLTKTGTGTVTLTTAPSPETYTGLTVISAGTLAFTGFASPEASSGVVDNGILDLTGAARVFDLNSLTGSGEVLSNCISPAAVSTGSCAVVNIANATGTFSGTLGTSSHPVALAINAGTQTVSGANNTVVQINLDSGAVLNFSSGNSYGSSLIVVDGTLNVSGPGVLGGPFSSISVSGGTLNLGGTTQTVNGGVTITGGTIQNGTLSSSATFNLQSQSGTVSAALAGTGDVVSSGGVVALSGVLSERFA